MEQAGQHGGLGGIHLIGRFSKIPLSCGLKATRPGAQRDTIEVDREDLILRVAQLHSKREACLFDLAPERALATLPLIGAFRGPFLSVEGIAQADQLRSLLRDG